MATEEDVKLRLSRLLGEVQRLQTQTRKLTETLGRFSDRDPADRFQDKTKDVHLDGRARLMTDEPDSEIRNAVFEFRDDKDLSVATKILKGIATEIGNALDDIRAARTYLDLIAKDSDEASDFREWQARNRK